MKVVVESITVFLLLNVVAPAPTYSIHDEKTDAGQVASIGATGSHKNRVNNHKKYFIGSNNQKYMKLVNERAVDSHFTVQKTPWKPYVLSEDGKIIEISEVARNSHNYRRKAKEEVKPHNVEYRASASTKNDLEETYQDKDKTTIPDNQAFSPIQNVHKYNQREFPRHGENIHDKKHNFVSMNAHKAAVSKDDKMVVKNNNQQYIHQQYKIGGVEVKDKNMHKTSAPNERNTQLVAQNGLTQKPISGSQKMESKKRDTVNIQPHTANNNSRSTSVSDKIRKYIHKDVNNYQEQKNTAMASRIGNHEDIMDVNETPYALFYRTNTEHLDDQEVLIENPLAEPTNSAYGIKMAWSIENEPQENPIKAKSKREPNVKIHKKVKNHTSYRNS